MGCVGAEVHEHLLQLNRVPEDHTRFSSHFTSMVMVVGIDALKELHSLFDNAGHEERLFHKVALAAEREHLLDQIPSAQACVHDPFETAGIAAPLGQWPRTNR